MNRDEIRKLYKDLEEAKTQFDLAINVMKAAGIKYSYEQLTTLVEDSYIENCDMLEKMYMDIPLYESLYEKNKTYLKRIKKIKIASLLFKLALFNTVMYLFFKSDNFMNKALAILAGITGLKGTNLVREDLKSRFTTPYRNDESLDRYFELDSDLYKKRKIAANDIEAIKANIQDLNYEIKKHEKERQRRKKERVENPLKG